jgi:hypothetical protein
VLMKNMRSSECGEEGVGWGDRGKGGGGRGERTHLGHGLGFGFRVSGFGVWHSAGVGAWGFRVGYRCIRQDVDEEM